MLLLNTNIVIISLLPLVYMPQTYVKNNVEKCLFDKHITCWQNIAGMRESKLMLKNDLTTTGSILKLSMKEIRTVTSMLTGQ